MAGEHDCTPENMPSGLGESWTCPDCGAEYDSYKIAAAVVRDLKVEHPFGWQGAPEEHGAYTLRPVLMPSFTPLYG